MNTQDHADRACATREQRVTTENEHKMASSRKHLRHFNSAPIGEEPREEYHAGFVSWAVTKTSVAMPAERRKGGS